MDKKEREKEKTKGNREKNNYKIKQPKPQQQTHKKNTVQKEAVMQIKKKPVHHFSDSNGFILD